MHRFCFRFLLVCGVTLLAACGRGDDTPTAAGPGPAEVAPAEQSAAAETQASESLPTFDLAKIPLSGVSLPPFPWIEWPETVPEGDRRVMSQKTFDAFTLIAGREFRTVEGRVEHRQFKLPRDMSQLEVRRTLASLIQSLGGVPVSELRPTTENASIAAEAQAIAGPDANVARLLGLHNYDEGDFEYESFVIRTPDATAWIVLQSSQFTMNVFSIEERPLVQRIGLVTAEAIGKALSTDGRIALYINFDTDAATLRPDASPVIAEIAAMLAANGDLRIAVEGHTDDTGTADRNRVLSAGRADAVVAALVSAGVAGDRLLPRGLGADVPLTDNLTEDGRARNRRVELVKL